MKRLSPGRRILTSVAALMAVGGFFADWNRTYLFNSNWPRSLGSPIEKDKEGAVIRRGRADDGKPILDLLERAKSRRLKPPDGPPIIAPPAN
jgi:hypothetical protein